MQDGNTNNANEADVAQQNDESGRAQEGTSEHQNELLRGAHGVQLPENSAPASKKRSLMERHPNASTYEVIDCAFILVLKVTSDYRAP
jgi:hypothetical protein